jgi:8-oxo-dGTP diphosphatase
MDRSDDCSALASSRRSDDFLTSSATTGRRLFAKLPSRHAPVAPSVLTAFRIRVRSMRQKVNAAERGSTISGLERMKETATVLCVRNDRILLVARKRSRWALPGGRIRHDETPYAAALRELEEETTLTADSLLHLFQFNGFNTQHHVFFADVGVHSIARPNNEIARCRWFTSTKIATLSASVPTRGIVELFFRHIRVPDPDEVVPGMAPHGIK